MASSLSIPSMSAKAQAEALMAQLAILQAQAKREEQEEQERVEQEEQEHAEWEEQEDGSCKGGS